jgi:predicted thioesterase
MINNTFNQTITVSENQTAAALGSGLLPVFSTPAMIALMENTAMKAMVNVPEGCSSVGTAINVKHLKASAVGEIIHCTALITSIDGRKYSFEIAVKDNSNNLVGEGTHERVIVNVEKFMSKI